MGSEVGLYRKRDGPEGECFVVNAHFNPLAVSDYEDAPLRSSLKRDSEITLSLSSCASHSEFSSEKVGFAEDKYPLQVVLPPEGSKSSDSLEKKEVPSIHECETEEEQEQEENTQAQSFECDVSVEAEAGSEKQEFLFTLYDLDGHGKITKDDIAGLVRSIYEAMGSSLELQPSGSKTIKVRLTVTPEKGRDEKKSSKEENDEDGETNAMEEPFTEERGYENNNKNNVNNDKNNEANIVEPSRTTTTCNVFDDAPRQGGVSVYEVPLLHGQKKLKNGMGFLQKHQLLEIIQANLQKNSFGYVEPARKHISDYYDDKRRHRQLRHQGVECRDRRSHYLDLAGVENFAAKFELGTSPCGKTGGEYGFDCPYQAMDTNHVCTKGDSRGRSHHACYKSHHHRSRSHDMATETVQQPFQYHLLSEEGSGLHNGLPKYSKNFDDKANWLGGRNQDLHSALYHARSKSYDAYYYEAPIFAPRNKSWMTKGMEPNGSSPHHHKHRHREREYQRAMQQVASWIEKEHLGLGSVGGESARRTQEDNRRSHYHNHHHHHPPPHHHNLQRPSSTRTPDKSPLAVERHEHHHIHEHFHHHYHHYHEL